jgi:hypothetical protein
MYEYEVCEKEKGLIWGEGGREREIGKKLFVSKN